MTTMVLPGCGPANPSTLISPLGVLESRFVGMNGREETLRGRAAVPFVIDGDNTKPAPATTDAEANNHLIRIGRCSTH